MYDGSFFCHSNYKPSTNYKTLRRRATELLKFGQYLSGGVKDLEQTSFFALIKHFFLSVIKKQCPLLYDDIKKSMNGKYFMDIRNLKFDTSIGKFVAAIYSTYISRHAVRTITKVVNFTVFTKNVDVVVVGMVIFFVFFLSYIYLVLLVF